MREVRNGSGVGGGAMGDDDMLASLAGGGATGEDDVPANLAGSGKYADLLHLPHHRSSKHQPLSMASRAAQFAPFAALDGYEEAIEDEEARLKAI